MHCRARSSALACGGVVALLIVAAALLNVFATSRGAGIWPDSVTYIQSARNLVTHHRFTSPSDERSHLIKPGDFPPLYSAVLAVPGSFGAEVFNAARWLQTSFLVCGCALFGLLLRRFARPPAVVAGVALLVFSSGFLVEVNGFVLSDSLFLCLTLLTLLWLFSWLQHPGAETAGGVHRLVLASLAAGTAAGTRYVGVSLAATVLVAATLLERRRPAVTVGLVAACSAAPLVVWRIFGGRVGAPIGLGDRILTWHPPGTDALLDALATTGSWIIPQRLGDNLPRFIAQLTGAGLVLTGTVLVVGCLRGLGPLGLADSTAPTPQGIGLLVQVVTLFVVLYLAVVIVTVSLLDAAVPFDRRILLPVFVVGLLVVVVIGDAALARPVASPRSAVISVGLAVLLLANGAATLVDVAEAHRDGLGFSSVAFRCSPLVAAVRQRHPGVGVYSNAPGALFFLTGTRAQAIAPTRYGNGSGRNPRFAQNMASMRNRVLRGRSIVVDFSTVERPFSPDLPTLRRVIGEPPLVTADDGVLFGRPSAFSGPLLAQRCGAAPVTSSRAAHPPT